MKTTLNTLNYKHVKSITIKGVEFTSFYNHNYYHNSCNDDLILETTNDDTTCYYYRIEINGYSIVKNYLGLIDTKYGQGIFSEDCDGYPYRNKNGEIELDDTLS